MLHCLGNMVDTCVSGLALICFFEELVKLHSALECGVNIMLWRHNLKMLTAVAEIKWHVCKLPHWNDVLLILETFQVHCLRCGNDAGMEGLFMPFDHQAKIPEGKSSQHTLKLLQHLNEGPCNGNCAVGSGGQQVGYLAHGTATDYVYLKGDANIAMTWEIYGDTTASYMDCFKTFNPITDEAFHTLLRTWSNAVFELLLVVRDHPDFASLRLHQISTAASINERPQSTRFLSQPAGQGPATAPNSVQYVWLVGIVVSFGSLVYVLLRSIKLTTRSRKLYS